MSDFNDFCFFQGDQDIGKISLLEITLICLRIFIDMMHHKDYFIVRTFYGSVQNV